MCEHTMMESYKVTRFGEPLEKIVTSLPVPGNTGILLRVIACGVCHSDLHLWDGYFDLGGGRKMDMSRAVNLPRTLGHEIVGEVIATGDESTDIPIGSRWIVYPWIGCGDCSVCRGGNEHLCGQPRSLGACADGGFSDHVVVPHSRYLVDFGDIPAQVACTYACSGLTALSALRKADPVSIDDPLMIIGAGGVGQSAIRLCTAIYGVAPSVADIDPAKRQAALDAGASVSADPNQADVRKTLVKATGGGYAAVIDFVGSQKTVEFGMALLRKGGKLIVVGLFGGSVEISIPLIPLRPISIIGSYVGSLNELRELAALGRAGKLPSILVENRPLSNVQDALDDLRSGKVAGRAILSPQPV